jgi:hypothetical protein
MPKDMRTEAIIAIKNDPKAGLRLANKHPAHTEELMELMERYGNKPATGNWLRERGGAFKTSFGAGCGLRKVASTNNFLRGFHDELSKLGATEEALKPPKARLYPASAYSTKAPQPKTSKPKVTKRARMDKLGR